MRALVCLLLIACGGQTKSAAIGTSRSVLEDSPAARRARLDAPIRSEQTAHVAVRHRRVEPLSWNDIVVTSRSGLFSGTSPPPPTAAQPIASPVPKETEKLVVEAWLEIETEHIASAVGAIRARVEASGGRVVSENVSGSGDSATSAAMELRVPPAQATAVTTWLATLGSVESKRVLASDVSKLLFDQELALKNLELTMSRLQKLAEASGPVADLLVIEKEMTRVRGEIETIKGEQRWLLDRVELATITVTLTREGGPVELSPHARVYPGPRVAVLTLFDPGMRQRTRVGGGATVHVRRHLTFDLDVFPRGDGGDSRAVIATVGTALYSGYLGFGRRPFLNPFIGARAGYHYLSGTSGLVVAGELGVELFRHRYLLVETSLRAVAFIREEGNETGLHATLGFQVPF